MTQKERGDKNDLMKEHEEAAREWAKMHNQKSPEEILMSQVLAGYGRNSQRDKDRERFSRG